MAKAQKKAKKKELHPWGLKKTTEKRRDVIRVIPASKEMCDLLNSTERLIRDPWLVCMNGGIVVCEDGKNWAIHTASNLVDNNLELGRKVQLVIHKKNGQIQSERTYPRSSDPKRHKG